MGASNRAARIAQDEIPAAFGITHPFRLQAAAGGMGRQFVKHDVSGEIFLGGRLVLRRRILQALTNGDQGPQDPQKTVRIQPPLVEVSGLTTCMNGALLAQALPGPRHTGTLLLTRPLLQRLLWRPGTR